MKTDAEHTDTEIAPLLPGSDFVIHVRPGERTEQALQGRVRHLPSGRSGAFSSLDELAAFMRCSLANRRSDRAAEVS